METHSMTLYTLIMQFNSGGQIVTLQGESTNNLETSTSHEKSVHQMISGLHQMKQNKRTV